MKVYVVTNNDNIIMAVCSTSRKANEVVNIGQNRWHEAWIVIPTTLDEIDPVALGGSESYNRMMKKIAEREGKK